MTISRRDLVCMSTPTFLNINLIQAITNLLAALKFFEKWLKQCQLLRVNSLKIILKKDIVIVCHFLEQEVQGFSNNYFLMNKVILESYNQFFLYILRFRFVKYKVYVVLLCSSIRFSKQINRIFVISSHETFIE